MTILEDATVPRPRLAEMVGRIDAIAASHDVPVATFGHAGDGNLHPTCCIDDRDPDEVARVHRAFDRIFTAALARGGTITGEHGVGVTKLAYLEQRLGPVGIDLLRGIKRAFDPLGLLNPGKAVP
jgi:glycolate oxidase